MSRSWEPALSGPIASPSKIPRAFESDGEEELDTENDVDTDWTNPDTEYQIEYIAAERRRDGKGTEYLIKWQDYSIGE